MNLKNNGVLLVTLQKYVSMKFQTLFVKHKLPPLSFEHLHFYLRYKAHGTIQ